MSAPATRYVLKPDRFSSHSVLLGWLGDGAGRRLLDVGAADGLLSRRLTERGWRVTAVEADAAAAVAGAEACEQMIVADLERGLPDPGGVFEVIVCADVLEHLTDPGRALRELLNHLAPGGVVMISVPNVAHLWMRLSLLAGRWDYGERGILDRTHLRFFTRRTLYALLETCGLRVTRATTTPVPLYQVLPARWHGGALAAVHALSAAASRALPRLLAYQFVVMARRP